MKVYLVGGAVRDERLGIPVTERDWCVVGATPDDMLSQRYKPVGKDFPVFLHPIQNFGGTQQMGGDLQGIADKLFGALDSDSSGNMIGMGAVPEGIHSDPVLWDMMFDLTYRNTAPAMTAWVKDYAKRRYGEQSDTMEEAWELLYDALYDNGGYGDRVAHEPSFDRLAFDQGRLIGLVNVWQLFMEEAERFGSVEPFRYDMMDVTHEVFAMYARSWLQDLSDLNTVETVTEFGTKRVAFLELLMDFDKVFNTHEHFSLCRWIGDARNLGSTEAEKDLFELNARLQVTIWGPGDTLNDYAAKTWGGLLKDFHARRWDAFLVNVEEGLRGNDPAAVDWIALEKEWTEETGICDAPDSTGSMWEEIAYVAEKYFNIDFTPVPTDSSSALQNSVAPDLFDAQLALPSTEPQELRRALTAPAPARSSRRAAGRA